MVNVKNLTQLVGHNPSLETLIGLDTWNMSGVSRVVNMFISDTKLSVIPEIEFWDISHISTFRGMFADMPSLATLNLSTWTIPGAAEMSYCFGSDSNSLRFLKMKAGVALSDNAFKTGLHLQGAGKTSDGILKMGGQGFRLRMAFPHLQQQHGADALIRFRSTRTQLTHSIRRQVVNIWVGRIWGLLPVA